MTRLTINNPNNFDLANLVKLLNSIDIEIIKIENEEEEEIPESHWKSIQSGLENLKNGKTSSSEEVRKMAKEICTK